MFPFARSFALLALLLFAGPSAARDPLRCEMKVVAEKLRDLFSGRKIKEIAVAEVSNAASPARGTAGPGIRQTLTEELERVDLKVKPAIRAAVVLTLTYRGRTTRSKKDRKVERLVVDLRVTATFKKDNSQEDVLSYRIDNEEAIRHLLGLTVGNRKQGKAREQETVAAFSTPKAHFDGSVVLAGEKSPFGVEILVEGNPLKPEDDDGFGRVKLRRDQTYAVRLINRSSLEMAVRLSVDGLNVFAFSELRHEEGKYKGAPLYDMVLVPARGSVTVPGWHKTNAITRKFKITHYADTAAAKLGKPTGIGTITATFCAAWEKTPPEDEPDGSRAAGDDGTGFGEPTKVKVTAVKRTIGAVRGSVAVRYKMPSTSKE